MSPISSGGERGPGRPGDPRGRRPLVLIAGPCVIESRKPVWRPPAFAGADPAPGDPLIFKSSYDKANRSPSLLPGPGLDLGLKILGE
jgi:3-deoxy-D-manno-octulosonic acid (KDO) 8-phosphate synthase